MSENVSALLFFSLDQFIDRRLRSSLFRGLVLQENRSSQPHAAHASWLASTIIPPGLPEPSAKGIEKLPDHYVWQAKVAIAAVAGVQKRRRLIPGSRNAGCRHHQYPDPE